MFTTELREDGFAGSAGGCDVEVDEAGVEEVGAWGLLADDVLGGAERAGPFQRKGCRNSQELGALDVHPPADPALSQGLGGETAAMFASAPAPIRCPLPLPFQSKQFRDPSAAG